MDLGRGRVLGSALFLACLLGYTEGRNKDNQNFCTRFIFSRMQGCPLEKPNVGSSIPEQFCSSERLNWQAFFSSLSLPPWMKYCPGTHSMFFSS